MTLSKNGACQAPFFDFSNHYSRSFLIPKNRRSNALSAFGLRHTTIFIKRPLYLVQRKKPHSTKTAAKITISAFSGKQTAKSSPIPNATTIVPLPGFRLCIVFSSASLWYIIRCFAFGVTKPADKHIDFDIPLIKI